MPASLLADVDKAARARGESRSRFIQRVLKEAIRAKGDADIKRRIDALFADPELQADQVGGAEWLESVGTGWAKERW